MAEQRQKVDLKEKVEEGQGLIKQIESAIPGFRGYRKREDLRIGDSLLRTQLADRIKNVGALIEECRNTLTKKMKLDSLNEIATLINKFNILETRIRHAEQGYVGISADYRIDINELNNLYDWDLKLIDNINKLNSLASLLKNSVDDSAKFSRLVIDIETKIGNFNRLFDKRIQKIEGLL